MNESRYLFRGKRADNGEWLIGGYAHTTIAHGVPITIADCVKHHLIFESGYYYEVDPATIAQCTGLKDKHGTLIFEGDICDFEYFANKYRGKIVFNPKTCAFEMWNNIIVGAYGEKATSTRLPCHCDNIRVIGSVHDNPELLDGYEQ